MTQAVLNAYLVYSDEVPSHNMLPDDYVLREIVFAKSRSKAKAVFCKGFFLPITAKCMIRLLERDVTGPEGYTCEDDDPLWEKVDPAFAAHIKREWEKIFEDDPNDE